MYCNTISSSASFCVNRLGLKTKTRLLYIVVFTKTVFTKEGRRNLENVNESEAAFLTCCIRTNVTPREFGELSVFRAGMHRTTPSRLLKSPISGRRPEHREREGLCINHGKFQPLRKNRRSNIIDKPESITSLRLSCARCPENPNHRKFPMALRRSHATESLRCRIIIVPGPSHSSRHQVRHAIFRHLVPPNDYTGMLDVEKNHDREHDVHRRPVQP